VILPNLSLLKIARIIGMTTGAQLPPFKEFLLSTNKKIETNTEHRRTGTKITEQRGKVFRFIRKQNVRFE
jgi:hypothetical protein